MSPKLTMVATVASKKTIRVTHNNNGCIIVNYIYQVGFLVENGETVIMSVPQSDYNLMRQGDVGRLTAKGTRYVAFER